MIVIAFWIQFLMTGPVCFSRIIGVEMVQVVILRTIDLMDRGEAPPHRKK